MNILLESQKVEFKQIWKDDFLKTICPGHILQDPTKEYKREDIGSHGEKQTDHYQ